MSILENFPTYIRYLGFNSLPTNISLKGLSKLPRKFALFDWKLIKSMMELRPRQRNRMLVFRLFSLTRGVQI